MTDWRILKYRMITFFAPIHKKQYPAISAIVSMLFSHHYQQQFQLPSPSDL
jgi:hypothetical protein